MRTINIIIALLILPSIVFAQCYFHKLYRNNNSDDVDGAYSIASLKNGASGFLVSGYTDFGIGNEGIFTIKINDCGDTLWQKVYDFSPSGGEYANSILNYTNNNYFLTGNKYSQSEGATDGFLIEIDSNGTVLNDTSINIAYNDRYSSSIIDGSDIITTGHFNNQVPNAGFHITKLDSLGNIFWTQIYDTTIYYIRTSVLKAADGGYMLSGNITLNGNYQWFLIKTDSLGNRQWQREYGDSLYQQAAGFIATKDSGFLLIGHSEIGFSFSEEYLGYIIKVNSSGDSLWSKTFGTPVTTFREGVQLEDGSFILVGDKDVPYNGTFGVYNWIVKLDESGNLLWEQEYSYYGIQTHNYVEDMAIALNGDIALTGYITSLPPWHSTGNDMFILKVDSCGYLDSDNLDADFSYSTDTATRTISFSNLSNEYCTSHWYFGDGDSSFTPNPVHTFGDTGTYTVMLIVKAGNSIDTISTTINTSDCNYDGVNALFQYEQDSSDIYTINFSNLSQDYCNLQWYFGDGDSSTVSDLTHTYSDTGSYIVTLIAYAGTHNDTFTKEITIELNEVGINVITNNRQSKIKVYPNPTQNILHIETLSQNHQIQNIQIIDINGRNIIQTKKSPINTSELSQGIYFYQVEMSNGELVRGKFVKE